jgi:hypothetical protein
LLTLHDGGDSPDNEPTRKHHFIIWDCDVAKRCIMADYLGGCPKFALDDIKDCLESHKVHATIFVMTFMYLAYSCSVNSFGD